MGAGTTGQQDRYSRRPQPEEEPEKGATVASQQSTIASQQLTIASNESTIAAQQGAISTLQEQKDALEEQNDHLTQDLLTRSDDAEMARSTNNNSFEQNNVAASHHTNHPQPGQRPIVNQSATSDVWRRTQFEIQGTEGDVNPEVYDAQMNEQAEFLGGGNENGIDDSFILANTQFSNEIRDIETMAITAIEETRNQMNALYNRYRWAKR